MKAQDRDKTRGRLAWKPRPKKAKKGNKKESPYEMSENIEREESGLILTHSNIVIVENVVRDKEINKRKNFSWNSNDSFFLARTQGMYCVYCSTNSQRAICSHLVLWDNLTTYLGATLTWEGRKLTSYSNAENTFNYEYDENGIRYRTTIGNNNTENRPLWFL